MTSALRFGRAVLLLIAAMSAGSGCARWRPPPVRSYQRAHLADRIMRVDTERLSAAADQHVLTTREGAVGGSGTAGGGCGCN